ncbi:phage tail protein [Vibrio coralliilyticus]|nr:phage tail protein [Vibrio coralliilyticus]QOU31924.1 phage tail protein [Vibrio coralliilyticus]
MKRFTRKLILTASLIPSLMFGSNAIACSDTPLIGTMCAFGGNFAPRGYALAQGQLLSIAQHTALFSILGTTYGGDGRTTFALPDTQGRALIGAGSGAGLSSYVLGAKGGVESVTLSEAQIPGHTHVASTLMSGDIDIDGVVTLHAFSGNSDDKNPANNSLAKSKGKTMYSTDAPDVAMNSDSISFSLVATNNLSATTTLDNTGGDQSHENRMPYVVVNWIIALQGIFPSRN